MSKPAKHTNVVTEAVDKAGGILKAAVVMGVSIETVRRYMRTGEVFQAQAAIKLAAETGIAVEKLAGIK